MCNALDLIIIIYCVVYNLMILCTDAIGVIVVMTNTVSNIIFFIDFPNFDETV